MSGGPRATRLLVLQAYGSPRIVQEARFAILTFLHFALPRAGEWRVVVYTDQPARFGDLGPGVVTEPIDPSRLAAWRGAIDFVHRVKLELLLDCVARHPGTLLYADSDTYFTADPWTLWARIGPGDAVMHEREGRLDEEANGIMRKMHRFVRDTELPLPGGERERIAGSTEMWNAGVVGLDASVAEPLLRRALALTDAMHARYRKHVTEQLAVSWVLQHALRLHAAGDVVHHYWRSCPEFEGILGRFFAEHEGAPLPALAAAAVALRPVGAPPAPRRRWWQRLLGLGRPPVSPAA